MKVRRGKIIGSVILMAVGSFLAVSSAHGQANPGAPATGSAAAAKPLMAEQAFKDVQILKGIPVDQFMDTMGFFAASLGLNCTDCHGRDSAGSWAKYADDNKLKTTARKMILMARSINEANFGGAPTITCYTCHRNDKDPRGRPSLAEQYSTNPPLGDPNDFVVPQQDPTMPTADQVFSKYVDAIGGAQHLAALTSYTAKGTYVGWDTEQEMVSVDIFAKSPNERTTIVHTANGDSTRVFDGSGAWIAAPDKPLPLIALTGGDLFGAKIDALVYLPTDIKKAAVQWRVGVLNIDGDDVQVVQGTNPGQLPVKLFFDPKTGLLTREVRVTNTSVGQVPTQIDFSDYRDVGGVKLPYKSVVSWTDGQATIVLDSIQPNVAIDPAKFTKPAPAKELK